MEGIIDKENERARRFFALLDNMEKKVERLARDNRPPFNGERFLASDADVGHQLLHIPWLVIELALEAGERQPSGIAECLQGTWRNVKAQADICLLYTSRCV